MTSTFTRIITITLLALALSAPVATAMPLDAGSPPSPVESSRQDPARRPAPSAVAQDLRNPDNAARRAPSRRRRPRRPSPDDGTRRRSSSSPRPSSVAVGALLRTPRPTCVRHPLLARRDRAGPGATARSRRVCGLVGLGSRRDPVRRPRTVGGQREDRTVDLGGRRQASCSPRCSCGRGEPAAADGLIEALWGEGRRRPPPRRSRSTVSRCAARSARPPIGSRPSRRLPPARRARRTRRRAVRGRVRARADARPGGRGGGAQRSTGALARPGPGRPRYEACAQAEIRRLEELRVLAIEDRVEAELALGEHAPLAGELEALSPNIRSASACAASRCSRSTGSAATPRRSPPTATPRPPRRRARARARPGAARPGAARSSPTSSPPARTRCPARRPRPSGARTTSSASRRCCNAPTCACSRSPAPAASARRGWRSRPPAPPAAASCRSRRSPTPSRSRTRLRRTRRPRVPGEPAEDALHRALAEEHAAVVLDNLEHLPGVEAVDRRSDRAAPASPCSARAASPLGCTPSTGTPSSLWPRPPPCGSSSPRRRPRVRARGDGSPRDRGPLPPSRRPPLAIELAAGGSAC